MSLSSCKKNLYWDCRVQKDLKAQFDVMHIVYVMILCHKKLTSKTLSNTTITFHRLISTYFDKHIEVRMGCGMGEYGTVILMNNLSFVAVEK